MNAIQEVREQYKQAVREYFRLKNTKLLSRNIEFYEGRMSGLEAALSCLGINNDEIHEMYQTSEEEVSP